MTQTISNEPSIQPTTFPLMAIVAGILIIASGLIWAGAEWQTINRMNTATGKIVQLDEYVDDHGIKMYLPVVEFATTNGQTVRTRTSIYQTINFFGYNVEIESVMGAPDQYKIGDRMQVYYDPSNPQDTHLNDWWQLWSTPVGVCAVGLIVVVSALVFRAMTTRQTATSGGQSK